MDDEAEATRQGVVLWKRVQWAHPQGMGRRCRAGPSRARRVDRGMRIAAVATLVILQSAEVYASMCVGPAVMAVGPLVIVLALRGRGTARWATCPRCAAMW